MLECESASTTHQNLLLRCFVPGHRRVSNSQINGPTELRRTGSRREDEGERMEGAEIKGRPWSSGLFSTEACDTGTLNKCSVCCSALQRN